MENEEEISNSGETHLISIPDRRKKGDRRKISCYIMHDKRSGIACRRKVHQFDAYRKFALSNTIFYS